jgi:hypothetical protein
MAKRQRARRPQSFQSVNAVCWLLSISGSAPMDKNTAQGVLDKRGAATLVWPLTGNNSDHFTPVKSATFPSASPLPEGIIPNHSAA